MSSAQSGLNTASRSPFSAIDGNAGFEQLLSQAHRSLLDLRALAEQICEYDRFEDLEFRAAELRSLCSMLAEGSVELARRAKSLGFADELPPRPGSRGTLHVNPVTLLAAYRGSCRRLCAAMKEAIRISDGVSVAMLRELILRLERQLWVIDAPSRTFGIEDSRAVALFLAC
jgi:hypothetical protein